LSGGERELDFIFDSLGGGERRSRGVKEEARKATPKKKKPDEEK